MMLLHRIRAPCNERIVFGSAFVATHTPLRPAPRPPEAADIVVIESTFGDCLRESREHRRDACRPKVGASSHVLPQRQPPGFGADLCRMWPPA